MTQTTIERQVKAIKEATADATKSKKSALAFLIAAGIVTKDSAKAEGKKLKKKK